MAGLSGITLPHGTIPTQMFGNVNLQNAMMYVNENFAAIKEGVNADASAANEALGNKADSDHNHDDAYAALSHAHGMDEITGLSAKLDDKASLNHEHSQYLSSLPAHYHDVSGIQGLGEQLQAKADKTHSHAMAQIDGLSTELGVKAATSYVDQQIAQVSGTVKTIADQEIVTYGANKGDAETDGEIPQNVVAEPSNETREQKNARVGTSSNYARADHKHVFSTSLGDDPTDNTDASVENDPQAFSLTFTDWTAGGDNGLKMRAYILIEATDPQAVTTEHTFHPIDIEIAANGIVKSVKVPSGNHGIMIGA